VTLAAAFFVSATTAGIAAACLAQWITPVLLPQVGLLAIAAWSYRRSGSMSVVAAWAVGWSFDALSVAAPGTHPFLFVLVWMATRFASHQVHLRSASAFALYLFFLTLGITLAASLMLGQPQLSPRLIVPALIQALVNALAAGPIRWLLWAILERFGEGEPSHSTGLSGGAALP
jgi:cell shape-determining protein MreD